MDEETLERVRAGIYRGFADQARMPSDDQLAAEVDIGRSEVRVAIQELAARRHLALAADGHVVLAHPFAAANFGFSVMGERRLWWGGCAWDSFAIPNLVPDEPRVLVATACPGCGRPLAWHVTSDRAPDGAEVAHFLVPMHQVWDDVVHTCSNQRLYCSEECVDLWLTTTARAKGYVMDLATLWRLARDWYAGRLDSPYQRRDPDSAKHYFQSVGLRGSFWGLDD